VSLRAAAQRCLGDRRLGLAEHVSEPTGPERGVEPGLLDVEPHLAEAAGLEHSRIPVVEFVEGHPAPTTP